jgi:hypothetical protein
VIKCGQRIDRIIRINLKIDKEEAEEMVETKRTNNLPISSKEVVRIVG